MKLVKDCCPDGGTNPLKSLYQVFVADENQRKEVAVPKTENIDNLGRYRDCFTKIFCEKPKLTTIWTLWMKNHFFLCLYNYLQCSEHYDCKYRLSPFYRLYRTYLRTTNEFKRYQRDLGLEYHDTFWDWLDAIVSNDFKCANGVFDQVIILQNPEDMLDRHIDEQYYADSIGNISPVTIFKHDFAAIKFFKDYKPEMHFDDKVIIQGLPFKCRGEAFAESAPEKYVKGRNAIMIYASFALYL